MKALFFSLIGLLCILSVAAQKLTPKDATNAYLVFQRGDGIDTYYKIDEVKIFIDEATIGRKIEAISAVRLAGFAKTQSISGNIYDFLTVKPVEKPVSKPDYLISENNRVRLIIPGVEDASDIYLADEQMKIADAKKLKVQLATHSISLGDNIGTKRSMASYKITDQTGKIWVEVQQREATKEGHLGGAFGNNHPDKQYLPWLSDDCNVYLPVQNRYTILIENRGAMKLDFWVHHPWSANAEERRLHREDIPQNATGIYTIDAPTLASMPDYMRAVKINCNGKL